MIDFPPTVLAIKPLKFNPVFVIHTAVFPAGRDYGIAPTGRGMTKGVALSVDVNQAPGG
jgi:hypothetical protein